MNQRITSPDLAFQNQPKPMCFTEKRTSKNTQERFEKAPTAQEQERWVLICIIFCCDRQILSIHNQ